jgi:hypothetical protein
MFTLFLFALLLEEKEEVRLGIRILAHIADKKVKYNSSVRESPTNKIFLPFIILHIVSADQCCISKPFFLFGAQRYRSPWFGLELKQFFRMYLSISTQGLAYIGL